MTGKSSTKGATINGVTYDGVAEVHISGHANQ